MRRQKWEHHFQDSVLCLCVTHGVRLLSCVNAQVALQGLQVTEAGAAGVAGVRFLPRVDQNMGPEVGDLAQEDQTSQTTNQDKVFIL